MAPHDTPHLEVSEQLDRMSSGWKQAGCYRLSESFSSLGLGVHVPSWEPSHPARPLICLVVFPSCRGAANSRVTSAAFQMEGLPPRAPPSG